MVENKEYDRTLILYIPDKTMKDMTDVFIAKKDDRPRISDFLKEHPEIEENFGK